MSDLIQYGGECDAVELKRFLRHTLTTGARVPVCVWGKHGIGKTDVVRELAAELGWAFAYVAPAQFEEMGDLVGMPRIVEADHETVTRFSPPDWVPRVDEPGILLIDDVNRADDRILRGIMQLLQNHALVSWELPGSWRIVLTANPDGGDYSVTPMDEAMITRMRHITLLFDVRAWALWAERSGVDSRGINFVLTYPELVSGGRTTPRTLVQFFESIEGIADLGRELPLVKLLADAVLDDEASAAFVAFVKNNLSKLLTPAEILDATDFPKHVQPRLAVLTDDRGMVRVDILATLATRIANHLGLDATVVGPTQIANLKVFLELDFLPNDIRLTLAQELVGAKNPKVRRIMADPGLSRLLLAGM